MKKSRALLILILFNAYLLNFTSCTQEWLDVNTDPNHPRDIEVEMVLPAAILSVATYYGGIYNLLGGFWAQYWAQGNASNTYRFIDSYDMEKGGYHNLANFDTAWCHMYAEGMRDLKYVIDKSEETDNRQYLFISTVMLAFCFNFMTDLYGAIPYSEALLGDPPTSNFNPVYENGESIYMDLINRLDKALANTAGLQFEYADQADLIFQGDIDQWICMANTLKLKMYLRMVYDKPTLVQEGIKAMYAMNTNFLSCDAKLDIYNDIHKLHNPLFHFDRYIVSVCTSLRVSETLFRYLEQNADPRLNLLFEDEFGLADHNENGMPQGGSYIPFSILNPQKIAVFNINFDDPVYFISEVESYLLQAEAIARGWGTGDDKYYYDLAITTDFSRKGLAGEEASLIGANGPYEYPTSGTFEEKLEAIAMAKWAALAGSQGLEAFFERSRTGYPQVSTVESWENNDYNPLYIGGKFTYSLSGVTGGVFPRRMIYPTVEINNNENFPGQTIVTDKVWWDKKAK